MKILYLSEDYDNTRVHHNLITALLSNSFNIEFVIFNTDREWNNNENKIQYDNSNYRLITQKLKAEIHKRYCLDFRFKINHKYNFLKKNINIESFDLVHAATLFSEGAVAYRIFKRYNIPYIVAVRGTDLSLYLKYMVHLWPLGVKILKNASKIILITNNLYNTFNTHPLIKHFCNKAKYKEMVIANGIDKYWHEHRNFEPRQNHNILYIGKFDSNKNVESLIKAVLQLKNEIPDVHLTLVGGGDSEHDKIVQYCKNNPDTLDYKGKIFDKDELRDIMEQNSVFAMVSHSETFGLVYVEALSQNLRILYTKGQGIDGTFTENVGEAVNSHSISSITSNLRKLLLNPSGYTTELLNIESFSWNIIAEEYLGIYESLLKR